MTLVVAIHDIAPRFLAEVRTLRAHLEAWGVDAVTLLAVPEHHASSRLDACPSTRSWLRERRAAGDEIALHGFFHRARGPIPSRWDRVRAAALTAGEGEMLAVPPRAVSALLDRGRVIVADTVGAPPAGFVAPAWLEPRGLGATLASAGFVWHETSMVVEDLRRRRSIASPVLGWATRSRWRELAAVTWARAMTPVADRVASLTGIVRVALHPGDAHSAAVMASIARTVRALVARHPAATTAAALDASLRGAASRSMKPASSATDRGGRRAGGRWSAALPSPGR